MCSIPHTPCKEYGDYCSSFPYLVPALHAEIHLPKNVVDKRLTPEGADESVPKATGGMDWRSTIGLRADGEDEEEEEECNGRTRR